MYTNKTLKRALTRWAVPCCKITVDVSFGNKCFLCLEKFLARSMNFLFAEKLINLGLLSKYGWHNALSQRRAFARNVEVLLVFLIQVVDLSQSAAF